MVSSAVGTAGIRGVGIGSAIAQAGAEIANIGLRDLARKQDIVDTIDATTRLRDFSQAQSEEILQIEQQFKDDPFKGVEEYKKLIKGNVDKFMGGTSSLNVKGKMVGQANSIVDISLKQMTKNAYNQNVVNVANQVNGEVIAAAERILARPEDSNVFTTEVNQIEQLVEQSLSLFSAKEGQKFKKAARESLALALTNGLKDENPLLGLDILKSGALNKLISAKQLEIERNALRSAVTGWQKRRDYNNIASLSQLNDNIIKDFLSGELRTAAQVEEIETAYLTKVEAEGLIPPPEHKRGFAALKKIVNEQTMANAVDNPVLIGEIEEKFQRLKFFEGDNIQYQRDILKFKIELMEAAAAGQIEQDTWKSYVKRVVIEGAKTIGLPTGDAVERSWINPKAWFGNHKIAPNTPEGFGTGQITSFIESFNFSNKLDKTDTQTKLNKDLLRESSELERKGIKLTESLTTGIANRLIFKEIQQRNPDLLEKLEGDLIYSNGLWFKVGIDQNGAVKFTPTKPSKKD